MPKSRKFRLSPQKLLTILGLVFTPVLGFYTFRYFYPSTQNTINLISNPVPLQYGLTSVTGTISKIASTTDSHSYQLILADSRPVALDVQDIDNFVGAPVTVFGVLAPAGEVGTTMTMKVKQITLN